MIVSSITFRLTKPCEVLRYMNAEYTHSEYRTEFDIFVEELKNKFNDTLENLIKKIDWSDSDFNNFIEEDSNDCIVVIGGFVFTPELTEEETEIAQKELDNSVIKLLDYFILHVNMDVEHDENGEIKINRNTYQNKIIR